MKALPWCALAVLAVIALIAEPSTGSGLEVDGPASPAGTVITVGVEDAHAHPGQRPADRARP